MELLMMTPKQREVYGVFEREKAFVATTILICLLFGLVGMLVFVFIGLGIISLPDYLLDEASKMFIATIPQTAGVVSLLFWMRFRWGFRAREARRYKVFKSRGGKFLDLGFATILLANLIFWFHQLNNLLFIAVYWIMAIISLKVLVPWVWFDKPPQENS